MNAQAFELIVLTPEQDFPQETAWVNRLFSEGLGTFHLRKPGRSSHELIHYLDGIEEQYHGRIMVHYQEEVLNEVAVKGIHYKRSQLPQQKPPYNVSCGCHSWEEFREVEERVDYAFVSPFFDSISKEGYGGQVKLREMPERVNTRKAIALGGIQLGNISQFRGFNLKGLAVLGAVWSGKDPLKAYRSLNLEVKKVEKEV